MDCKEQIAKAIGEGWWRDSFYGEFITKDDRDRCRALSDAILAIPEIEEGQELLEKAKSGVLVELAETAANLDGVQPPNYSECLKIANRLGTSLANVAAIYGEIQKDSSLKRVIPLASKE